MAFDPSAAAAAAAAGGGGLGAFSAMDPAVAQETLRAVMNATPEQLAAMNPQQRQVWIDVKQAVLMQTQQQQQGGMR